MDAGYLDHAASTLMRPEAVDAMLPWLRDHAANPSGAHRAARSARKVIDESRDIVAAIVGCKPGEVVFTSGGTEADNMAVFGSANRGGLVCSAIEHHAVLDPVTHLGGSTVDVGGSGTIDLDHLKASLSPDVGFMALMAINNETGVRQPVAEAAAIVREVAPDALLHTDAVQAFMWTDPSPIWSEVDLMSLSGHKFGGPKGTGVLVIRDGVKLDPVFRGGGQERERRSGTQNVAGIVAFATAMQIAHRDRDATVDRIAELRTRLADGISAIDGARLTADAASSAPGILHMCLEGIESESLLYLLETNGVFASAASSCASGAMEPSHVLAAMGIDRKAAAGSLRLSLGWPSTEADVDLAVEAVTAGVDQLRSRA